ncbi:MAG: bifunctional riboflavin kinase/FAD synthetase [Gammaproteobacteria bacterium]|nr:bifunctional riboflavin kinase/FAD synthetase [Gammaproteobacteria bacterium]NVK89160.1 bifunctional riboflavin kinase/FAD synthetase [Gammaproteobacteria bacterium]
MQLIHGLNRIPEQLQGCVATIGKFDGIHLGHQQILAAVSAQARSMGLASAVIVFEPDPQEYFAGDKAPARLTRFAEKWRLFAQMGIEKVICLRFAKSLASMSAQDFIQELLIRRLQVKHLIVGDDFRFGRQRQGDYELLQQLGAGHFGVQNTASIKQGTERISSTLIRHKLQQGDFTAAEQLLGRAFSMTGRVVHGDKLGRTLDFPTINVPLRRRVSPLQGVYVVKVYGLDEPVFGVANVGTRPTVDGQSARVEAHLFDFDRDCYGAQVELVFLHRIRNEQKFASVEALKKQIQCDVTEAKAWLKNLN